MTTGKFEDLFDDPVEQADDQELIEELQKRGWLAHKPEPAIKPVKFDKKRIEGKRVKLGVISDTHFGSKFQQPTLLKEHLNYMRTQEVDAILHGGDITDGAVSMHPGFEYELWAHGADAQVEYACEVMIPEADKMKVPWYFIGGNHDNSHFKAAGTDVADRICRESKWFNYLSPGQGNSRNSIGYVEFGNLMVQVSHPHKGSSYALSYTGQKWIEQLSSANKPHLALQGNFHKSLWMEYRNVSYFMLPAFQAQTAWMAAKGIANVCGSVIIDVGTDPHGMAPSIIPQFLIERAPNENDWPGG